ncbi:La-related protein 1C [Linum perenne]
MENSGHSITANHQLNSPQSGRSGKTMVVSSPWNQVVRGESESNSVAPLSPSAVSSPTAVVSDQLITGGSVSSDEEISNGNAAKRPVWNVPSNGALEIGPVMGAVSWPALSESARVSSKSSLPDGSSTQLPVSGSGTASSSPRKQVNNATSNSTPNHTVPVRQRSFKQRNGASSSDASSPQPVVSQGHAGEPHLNNPFQRDHSQRSSQPRNSNDHSGQQRGTFRNRNGGPHPRADGSYNHNYGGRRDHDRGNQDWNSHRMFNGRDGHVQPQRVAPRFMRHPPPPPPPPASTPFIASPPVRAFGGPMGFPELASPMYYVAAPPPPNMRGMPFVAAPMPPHAVFFPAPDFQLHSKIVTQIDYYFSNENLIRDTFLRQNMDEQGWVSQLTDNIQLILDALRASIVVEVQGDKVRRRNDWMRWLMPPTVQFPKASSTQVPAVVGESSSQQVILESVKNISLEEKATETGDLNGGQSQPSSSSEGTTEVVG